MESRTPREQRQGNKEGFRQRDNDKKPRNNEKSFSVYRPGETNDSKPQKTEPIVREKRAVKPKLPIINLEKEIKDIKLNDEQEKKIKELEQKIHEIGEPKIPSAEEHQKYLDNVEQEISSLRGKSQTLQLQLDDALKSKDSLNKSKSPKQMESESVRKQITQFNQIFNSKREQLEHIKEKIDAVRSKKDDLKKKIGGFEKAEKIKARIEELEELNETQSTSNTVLKKRLGEIDSLQKLLLQSGNFIKLDEEMSTLRSQEAPLKNEINEIYQQRSALFTKLEGLKDLNAPEEYSKINASIDKLRNESKEVNNKIRNLEQQKWEQTQKYRHDTNGAYEIKYQVSVLKNEVLQIYKEAERRMKLFEEGAKKAGQIRDAKNPKDKEIQLAKSLVTYLESVIGKETTKDAEDEESSTSHVGIKKVDEKKNALIESLRTKKTNKKDKKVKKVTQDLVHDAQTIQQFSTLNIKIPTKIQEAEPVINLLNEMIKSYSASFIRVQLKLDINLDGSIKTSISLE